MTKVQMTEEPVPMIAGRVEIQNRRNLFGVNDEIVHLLQMLHKYLLYSTALPFVDITVFRQLPVRLLGIRHIEYSE